MQLELDGRLPRICDLHGFPLEGKLALAEFRIANLADGKTL